MSNLIFFHNFRSRVLFRKIYQLRLLKFYNVCKEKTLKTFIECIVKCKVSNLFHNKIFKYGVKICLKADMTHDMTYIGYS